jgi:hypothetical protein
LKLLTKRRSRDKTLSSLSSWTGPVTLPLLAPKDRLKVFVALEEDRMYHVTQKHFQTIQKFLCKFVDNLLSLVGLTKMLQKFETFQEKFFVSNC